MNMSHGRIALVLFCTAACSAASSASQEAPAKDAGAHETGSGSGSSSGGSTEDAAPPKQHDPKECAGAFGPCGACCEDYFQSGSQFYALSAQVMPCQGQDSCADVCPGRDCEIGQSRILVCEQCIQAKLDSGCRDKAKTACAGDTSCSTYLTCLSGCQ